MSQHVTLRYIMPCCIFLELNGGGDTVTRGEEADDEDEHSRENIIGVTTDNPSNSNINGTDSETDDDADESITGSIEQITVEPGNQNCEDQICIEATTGNAGDNNKDNSDKDLDDGDGSTHEVGGEDYNR